LADPDRYTWDLGDTLENATRDSIGAGVYEQVLTPEQQEEYTIEFYRPLVDAGRLLGIHNSNHGYRTDKAVGRSPIRILCREIGVPFLGWQNVFSLKVGENHQRRYNIFSWHGKYSGRSVGGALNALVAMASIVHNCDAYCMGHIHRKLIHEDNIRVPGKTRLNEIRRHFLACGGFIDYDDSYAEMMGLLPALPGTGTLRFYKTEPRVELIPLDL